MQSNANFVCVPVDSSLFHDLYAYGRDGTHRMIQEVLAQFLDRVHADQEQPRATARQVGVRWEGVPLPVGTEVRTKYRHEYKVAKVIEEGFLFEGNRFTSAAQLCNHMRGGTQNNAWIHLDIKVPGGEWLRADTMRRSR